jgi:hypothetical protein
MVGITPYHWGDSGGREGPNCSHAGDCLSMCYGGVCGLDGQLFGKGCQGYPKLLKKMAPPPSSSELPALAERKTVPRLATDE